jgi:xylulose-5-phosphate/fructose-6-phosphate phosphoketolase
MADAILKSADTAADDEVRGTGETVAPEPYVLRDAPGPLGRDELRRLDAWWRAANYLAVGQIYLMANPLLREPLDIEHIKPRLLGHFGTVPGLNLVWAHANRQIRRRDLDAVFVAGPGHGGPGPNACAWLEGTYSELYRRTKRGWPPSSTSSPSPAGYRATARPRHRVHFTKEESWATHSCTRTAPLWTTRR